MEFPLQFPFIDRRQSFRDRRSGSERRHKSALVENERRATPERRSGRDRRQWQQDREKILQDIRIPELSAEGPGMKYLRLFLLPAVIGLGSAYITYFVNLQQIDSARLIADKQIESARIIAEGQLDNSTNIAEAELKTQKLEQMLTVFSQILDDLAKPVAGPSLQLDPLRKKIASLEVYRDDALYFLLQLRDYDTGLVGSSDGNIRRNYQVAAETALRTIQRILAKSQPDLSDLIFTPEDSTPLNLRNREYIGYNMSRSKFSNVNLFNTDFSDSTLIEATFEDADLVRANFKGANLQKATFRNVDVRGVNFAGARLKEAKFENVKHIEDAKFSVYVLLYANEQPAKLMTDDQLKAALSTEVQQLMRIQRETPQVLDQLYERLNVKNFDELKAQLEPLLSSNVADNPADTS